MPRKSVRWAHLDEIDGRTRVNSEAWWTNNSVGARRLSAWRNLHRLTNHAGVSAQGNARGKSPSSNMTTRQMIAAARDLGDNV